MSAGPPPGRRHKLNSASRLIHSAEAPEKLESDLGKSIDFVPMKTPRSSPGAAHGDRRHPPVRLICPHKTPSFEVRVFPFDSHGWEEDGSR